MLPHDIHVEIFTHIRDPITVLNYVRCNTQLAAIGRKHKEDKIQQLLIPQVVAAKGENRSKKYSMLPNKKRHGLYQEFQSTFKYLECMYIYGELHGLYRKRYCCIDGLAEEINYNNGLKHGLSRKWTTGRILLEKTRYVNGKRFDIKIRDGSGNLCLNIKYTGEADYNYSLWYDRSTQLKSQRTYKNNVVHGLEKRWHPNGQLRKLVKYENGLKQGLSENWNANGFKIQEICYVNNVKQGWRKLWNERGTLIWDTLYVNGRATQS